jgi:hypothetical protein
MSALIKISLYTGDYSYKPHRGLNERGYGLGEAGAQASVKQTTKTD